MNSLTEWAVTGLDIENPWAMGIIQVTVKPLVISDWALVLGKFLLGLVKVPGLQLLKPLASCSTESERSVLILITKNIYNKI